MSTKVDWFNFRSIWSKPWKVIIKTGINSKFQFLTRFHACKRTVPGFFIYLYERFKGKEMKKASKIYLFDPKIGESSTVDLTDLKVGKTSKPTFTVTFKKINYY